MTETDVKRDIAQTARAMGAKCHRLNGGRVRVKGGWMHFDEDGTPDLLTVWPNSKTLYVEVKKPGESPTAVQKLRHRELRNMGHSVVVCHSVDEFVEAAGELNLVNGGKHGTGSR